MSCYAIIKNDKVFEAPVTLRSRWNDIGGFHLLTDEERKLHGWYPCTITGNSYDSLFENRSLPEYSFDGEVAVVRYTVTEKSIEEIKRFLMNLVTSNMEASFHGLVSEYSDLEHKTFNIQKLEALDYNTGNSTPLLDAICKETGEDIGVLVEKILVKSNKYSATLGSIIGKQKDLIYKISSSESIESLKTIYIQINQL